MTNSHSDQIENRGEDGYGKSVGYIPLKDEFHRIYPFLNYQTSREEIFTIFLPNSSKKISFRIFADDTYIFFTGNDPNVVEFKMNEEIR